MSRFPRALLGAILTLQFCLASADCDVTDETIMLQTKTQVQQSLASDEKKGASEASAALESLDFGSLFALVPVVAEFSAKSEQELAKVKLVLESFEKQSSSLENAHQQDSTKKTAEDLLKHAADVVKLFSDNWSTLSKTAETGIDMLEPLIKKAGQMAAFVPADKAVEYISTAKNGTRTVEMYFKGFQEELSNAKSMDERKHTIENVHNYYSNISDIRTTMGSFRNTMEVEGDDVTDVLDSMPLPDETKASWKRMKTSLIEITRTVDTILDNAGRAIDAAYNGTHPETQGWFKRANGFKKSDFKPVGPMIKLFL